MSTSGSDLGRVLEAIERLRGDVARLEARIAQLEAGRRPGAAAAAEAQAWRDAGAAEPLEAPDLETVMTISAAVAAYLGKKPRIRAIRLLGSGAWAQQGRATIHAWYSVSSNPTR
jgi:methylmalonyl-CoA carboxyltransferase 12S subunit